MEQQLDLEEEEQFRVKFVKISLPLLARMYCMILFCFPIVWLSIHQDRKE